MLHLIWLPLLLPLATSFLLPLPPPLSFHLPSSRQRPASPTPVVICSNRVKDTVVFEEDYSLDFFADEDDEICNGGDTPDRMFATTDNSERTKMGTSTLASFSRSTIDAISLDYAFPSTYVTDILLRFGATPPLSPNDIIGDLINSEQCFALLEALTSLDPADIDDCYHDDSLEEIAQYYDRDLGEVFEAAVKIEAGLPMGVKTRLRNEEVNELFEVLGIVQE